MYCSLHATVFLYEVQSLLDIVIDTCDVSIERIFIYILKTGFNNRNVIAEVDVTSCTLSNEDGLFCLAFHTGTQFIDDYTHRSIAALDLFFASPHLRSWL